jgi:hypothetical protein
MSSPEREALMHASILPAPHTHRGEACEGRHKRGGPRCCRHAARVSPPAGRVEKQTQGEHPHLTPDAARGHPLLRDRPVSPTLRSSTSPMQGNWDSASRWGIIKGSEAAPGRAPIAACVSRGAYLHARESARMHTDVRSARKGAPSVLGRSGPVCGIRWLSGTQPARSVSCGRASASKPFGRLVSKPARPNRSPLGPEGTGTSSDQRQDAWMVELQARKSRVRFSDLLLSV